MMIAFGTKTVPSKGWFVIVIVIIIVIVMLVWQVSESFDKTTNTVALLVLPYNLLKDNTIPLGSSLLYISVE
jgi:hypothetical protein